MKRILPPALFLSSCIAMLLLNFLLPLYIIITFPFNLLGCLPLAAGIALSIAGSNKFKRIETTVMTFDEPDILVCDGLYKISRNPMYLGFAVSILGVWMLLGSITSLLIALIFIAIVNFYYIPYEEKMLEVKFGKQYLAYTGKVRRWI